MDKLTVDINSLKHGGNEALEGSGEVSIPLAIAVFLNSLLKLIDGHLAILKVVVNTEDQYFYAKIIADLPD